MRARIAALALVTAITAWLSYGVFHNDEYFQVIELARSKLVPEDMPLFTWEHTARIRPWLQPAMYWLVGLGLQGVGVRDVFAQAFVFRLLTGMANVGALALLFRTTLPWWKTEEERRLSIRALVIFGFLPYLFVRTSSESASMAALTAAFAILLEGARPGAGRWDVPALAPGQALRVAGSGFLLGVAFELRFQTAFAALGLLAWLALTGRRRAVRAFVPLSLGGAVALALGAFTDRWGYGAFSFTPWRYLRVNVLEGAARTYGTDPPFSYFWLLPANVFFPVVVALLVIALVAWLRCSRHPITWTTLPFFLGHNLLAHKEERFLFPLASLATVLVPMALAPSVGPSRFAFVNRISVWGWSVRERWPARVLAVASVLPMALLAVYPLGWRHDVRFTRWTHERFGDELHAVALPNIGLAKPAFHPRVYDVVHGRPEEIAAQLADGGGPEWLIADWPVLETGTELDRRATLVYSELPGYADPVWRERMIRGATSFNAHARGPLRRLHFRSLYRLDAAPR